MSTLAPDTPLLLDKANMSLQRVFESARKLGLPVVVTDPAGREPMVVLSLEQFEAMAGSTENVSDEPRSTLPPKAPKNNRKAPETLVEPTLTDLPGYENGNKSSEQRSEPVMDEIQVQNQQNPEISLDERFYLEPLEDGSAG